MTVTIKYAKNAEQMHKAIEMALTEKPEKIPRYDKQFVRKYSADGVVYHVTYTIKDNVVVRVMGGVK